MATQNSTPWNFVFTVGWVFGERVRGESRLLRMGYALLTNNVPLLVRVPLLVILSSALGMHHLASSLISFLTLGLARHPLSHRSISAESLYKPPQEWLNHDLRGIPRSQRR